MSSLELTRTCQHCGGVHPLEDLEQCRDNLRDELDATREVIKHLEDDLDDADLTIEELETTIEDLRQQATAGADDTDDACDATEVDLY